MDEIPAAKNPYAHMKQARQLEETENMKDAEAEWKLAVRSADSLPMEEYRRALQTELLGYQSSATYQAQPGVTENSMRRAFGEVLSLPFITRIELASFYARHGAYSEAKDACEQSFASLTDAACADDPRVKELYRRATIMRQTLADTVGPERMQRLFEENFSKLDADGNGYVHHSELEHAQFDLTLSPECQMLIRHLLHNYFEVEAAHHDEWGIDIKGISLRDVQAYATRRNADWKHMSKNNEDSSEKHHKWW